MSGTPARSVRVWLTLTTLLSLLWLPAPMAAAPSLAPGDRAIIADANGDLVRLREAPGTAAPVISAYPEGTAVEILDGPVADGDGTSWYRVTVEGKTGYLAAMYLAPAESPASQPAGDSLAGAAVTGTARIVNTNGDPIRCRAQPSTDAEILANLWEGQTVDLLGAPAGGWQPVRCAGQGGYVAVDFLDSERPSTPAATPDAPVSAAELPSSGTAVVTGTNGDGVRCRAEASLSGAVITVLAEGTTVSLRGSAQSGWQPVICANQQGWVSASFLQPGPSSSTDASGGVGGPGVATGLGFVRGTNGDGVRCRSKANSNASVIVVLPEGAEIALRGAVSGSWQPVTCAGQKGWVYAAYIGAPGSGDTGGGGGGSSTGLVAGDIAVVTGTNGDGVRLRAKASFSGAVITVVGEGQRVDVVSGSTGPWVAVTYRGNRGFIHGDYLAKAPSGGTGGSTGGLGPGAHALVTDNLRLRASASFTADVLAIAPPGTVVSITGSAVDGFYPVQWDDLSGFMFGDYLEWTDAPLTSRDRGVSGNAGSEPGSPAGQRMVEFAMQYLGYPYVWATHGPDTFDCSGFTYWVALNVLGIDITPGTWFQQFKGKPVPYGQLQPGDLVFFQNTYTWGLSHVGIYIGNNQFIHAENEQTGVVISRIDSPYYASRWYGARRLT
ncbi:MAG: peptidase M24 [Thermomicrobiales bacterium]|nr:MAG: peptidase M24 [Thermomicrobiales bacterium]